LTIRQARPRARGFGYPQSPEAAALADDARTRERADGGHGVGGQFPLLARELGDELSACAVVLARVVIVDRLLDQAALGDECIDGRGGGVSEAKEGLAVDLAHDSTVDLDARVGPDHLQVEHEPARPDCADHIAQDVHDVLGLYSSERPGEDDEVERVRFDLDLLARGDLVDDAVGKCHRQEAARPLHRFRVGIEGQHAGRLRGDPEREPAVAATELQHALVAEVSEAAQCCDVLTLGVEHAVDGAARFHGLGLYALRVVPRAPNFCALRRVSSNVERA
jgi:hypothetical protein